MQLISLQQRNTQQSPPRSRLLSPAGPGHDDDDPPPRGGLAIHLRDVRFDPPVVADAMARWAA